MQRIGDSELIINARGAVYHLDLRPEELAPTVITVGDPDRVREVSKHFDKVEYTRQHREFVTHTGFIGDKSISVVSTGIGPDNIDIVLNELDALVNIDLETRTIRSEITTLDIIRIGTSGSLQEHIPADSFVASTHGLGLDNLLHFYRHEEHEEEKQLLQAFVTQTQLHHRVAHPYISGGAPGLLKKFVGEDFHHGITVTCPGFYGPQGRILRLGLAQPELINRLTSFSMGPHRITNFEMETSAIYGLGKMLGHRCLSLSAIVANRVAKTFTKDGQGLMEKLIKEALERICNP
ncbi:nucleoside phosphorylase [Parasegetibacter sp. NRK P23]|uniref:nucleoside phosphorylase n=1 Tax=Parasegetibacter sp. NRK P23 TaxID=2942999 RepID=UPI002043E2E9|nr:nucleoside phosphorylase [Parasegetibacter sp. NRK P23]MCM5528063.1 nucleoside phosphorylase [Parasegetibacter sp. NRK P23]